jgi:hypothetical protein
MSHDWLGAADMERKCRRENLGRASESRSPGTRSSNDSIPHAPSKTLTHSHLCSCGIVWTHTPAPEFGRCLYAGSTVPCPTCFDKENP